MATARALLSAVRNQRGGAPRRCFCFLRTCAPVVFNAFSRCDAYESFRESDTCLHLEQADTEQALRGLGLQKEALRRVLRHYPTVLRVTLCVGGLNGAARAAWGRLDFELWQEDGELDWWGVLQGDRLERLRSTSVSVLSEHTPAALSFLSLCGGQGLFEETMLQALHSPSAVAALPSPGQSICLLARDLCSRNLSQRKLLERKIVRSPKQCEGEARGLLTSPPARRGRPGYFYVAALLPRSGLHRERARLRLHEVSIPASSQAAVLAASTAFGLACTVATAEEAAVACMGAQSSSADATLERRAYSGTFNGPAPVAQARGYAGSERLKRGQQRPLSSENSARMCAHKRGEGAAWTRGFSSEGIDFRLP